MQEKPILKITINDPNEPHAIPYGLFSTFISETTRTYTVATKGQKHTGRKKITTNHDIVTDRTKSSRVVLHAFKFSGYLNSHKQYFSWVFMSMTMSGDASIKCNMNQLNFKKKRCKDVLPCKSPADNLFANLLELKFQGTRRRGPGKY